MRIHEKLGVAVPEVLLPAPGTDLQKWAVVACDQYTAEPDYWRRVDELVGQAPSALRLIYPEAFLGEKDPEARIAGIRRAMQAYLDRGLLVPYDGLVYVERQISTGTRRGVVLCLDLEQYDFRRGSQSLVRATEATIVERIPPRVKIRRGAPLELPHIMVLVDDAEDRVLGPLAEAKRRLEPLYDFDLMMGAGRLCGWRVGDRRLEQAVMDGLAALAHPEAFACRYGLGEPRPVLLYAMGDGNHSLATAKAIWDETKQGPARWALVELVSLHDPALVFEPIHRVLFGLSGGADPVAALQQRHGARCRVRPVGAVAEMKAAIEARAPGRHRIGVVRPSGCAVVEVRDPDALLAVGTLQEVLDGFLEDAGTARIDYVHGAAAVESLGRHEGNAGFYLPAMDKRDLFKSVIWDGVLPRKTFSMGEAHEKRFYLECRRLA
ncbi:MAG: DUF1015 domain-containing protein [Deltaproteobacteria bacterium]|nr:DUF1015 domain-containing protein [Deltaproteobacteria bacterium]